MLGLPEDYVVEMDEQPNPADLTQDELRVLIHKVGETNLENWWYFTVRKDLYHGASRGGAGDLADYTSAYLRAIPGQMGLPREQQVRGVSLREDVEGAWFADIVVYWKISVALSWFVESFV